MNIHIPPSQAHAVYAPSSASRWIPCTASAEAIAMLPPQEEGEEAAEGTEGHNEIERRLKPLETNLLASPRPVDIDHPAAYGVALFVDYVRKLIGTPTVDDRIWIEQRVALTDRIWGRSDVQYWHAESRTLTIPDYKNGQRAVDVEENEQLRIYAVASMFTHKLPVKWVRYVIVQPYDWRPFVPRVKQWIEPVESLYQWAEKVAAIPNQPKTFRAGDHCRDCPLFGKCEASLDMLANVGALVSGLVQPEDVRSEQVAMFLAMQKPVEDAFKKFKKSWETRALKAGSAPPEMKLVETNPHRAWTDEAAARALIVEKIGAAGLDVPTPAQAIERGLSEAVVHTMAPRPKGGPALAFASDKRKAWVQKSAAEMFGDVAGKIGVGK